MSASPLDLKSDEQKISKSEITDAQSSTNSKVNVVKRKNKDLVIDSHPLNLRQGNLNDESEKDSKSEFT